MKEIYVKKNLTEKSPTHKKTENQQAVFYTREYLKKVLSCKKREIHPQR